MCPKRTRQNHTKVDQTRPKVVIRSIPRAEGVAQDLKVMVREMGFVADDLAVPRSCDPHRAIGFLYLRDESGLGAVAGKLDGCEFKERRLEAHAKFEIRHRDSNVDNFSRPSQYQSTFDDGDEDESTYEERNVSEKRSRE